MNVGVVGLGYVGLVTAAVLAENGNSIVGIEIDRRKLKVLKSGKSPIFEPGLEESLRGSQNRIIYSDDYTILSECSIIYVTVPTPNVNGKIDLSFVNEAVGKIISVNSHAVIAIKSTVLPGTATSLFNKFSVKVVSNPEFTREGSAMEDTRKPDRIVIGSKDSAKADLVRKLWEFTGSRIMVTTNENAELIKYASNAFLATKISFINEIANLCEKIPNSDVNVVAEGMGYDRRIAPYFLKAGLGYGGSCFPKDTQALSSFALEKGERMRIIEEVMKVNSEREERVISLCESALGGPITSRKICVLGISFKNDTDDVRESKALNLVRILVKKGADVRSYDPVVRSADGIRVTETVAECLSGTDIAIVATEWEDFRNYIASYDGVVVDARRIIEPKDTAHYVGVGRGHAED